MRLSVVVASRDAAAAIGPCLASLEAQATESGTQVVVADGSRDGTADRVADRFGWVDLLRLPAGTGLGHLRAAGLARATGDVVAFTDVTCRVAPDWLARLRGEPWDRYAAVAGVVVPRPRRNLANWAAFLSEYAPHLPPQPAREAHILTGNNIGFARASLERAGLLGTASFWKTFAVRRLAECGERFWVDPGLVVEHERSVAPGRFTAHRFLHGRCFGATRVAGRGWPVRLARAATCPIVPLVLTARVGAALRDAPAAYRDLFRRGLGWLLVYHAAWACGEATGYLRGAGDACEQAE